MPNPRRFAIAQIRGVAAGALGLVVIAAMAVLAGVGSAADSSSSAAAYQYGAKVTICHHTHSKKHPTVTITVGQAAVQAHLKHGDTIGRCPTVTPKQTNTSKSKHAPSHKPPKAHGAHAGSTTTSQTLPGTAAQAGTSSPAGTTATTSHAQGNDRGHGNGHGH